MIFNFLKGKYEYKDGRKYEGQFKNNLRHGKGIYHMGESGMIYDGDFVNGVKDGQAKLTW